MSWFAIPSKLPPVTTDNVSMFAVCAIAAGVGMLWPHIRRAWHGWRLDRRFSRDGAILREEYIEYERAMGDEPPALEPAKLVSGAIFAGLVGAVPDWLTNSEWRDVALAGGLVLFAGALVYSAWRKLNDPDPEVPEESFLEIENPIDGMIGMVVALTIVVVFIGLVGTMF